MTAVIFRNDRWSKARPKLSVLTPFLRDDPTVLLDALAAQAGGLEGAVEIVVLDDGSRDAALTTRLQATVETHPLPASLVTLPANEGRSKGRNRLAGEARSANLLFVDSDMLPDTPTFLATYLKLIAAENPAVAFGGFSLDQTPHRPEFALHRAMAMKSDCLPAAVRRQAPEKHIFTSNLLIRRDVFEAETFDERFTGWGWEDVEWGIRVSRRWPIVHLDNTATHLGLDLATTMASKYEQSAANFARVVESHRPIVSGYGSYKAARILKRAPLRPVWRPMLKAIALNAILPMGLRAFSMRLYRAALYAEAV